MGFDAPTELVTQAQKEQEDKAAAIDAALGQAQEGYRKHVAVLSTAVELGQIDESTAARSLVSFMLKAAERLDAAVNSEGPAQKELMDLAEKA